MLIVRLTKVFMVAALAAYVAIVVYNNIYQWDANFAYVQHVMSMDTVADNPFTDRAITDPQLWRYAFLAIIVTQAGVALLLMLGALDMLVSAGNALRFAHAKTLAAAGIGVAFGLWFLGFMVIGGEYFLMWQSKEWNAQMATFRVYMSMLAVLIFVYVPDADMPPRPPRG